MNGEPDKMSGDGSVNDGEPLAKCPRLSSYESSITENGDHILNSEDISGKDSGASPTNNDTASVYGKQRSEASNVFNCDRSVDSTLEYNSSETVAYESEEFYCDWLKTDSFEEKVKKGSFECRSSNSKVDSKQTDNNSDSKEFNKDYSVQEDVVKRNTANSNSVLLKVASVERDAETVLTIINGVEIDTVYEKLVQKRDLPNRIQVVTNDLLEDVTSSEKEKHSKNNFGESGEDIFEDVDSVLLLLRENNCQDKVDPNEIFNQLEIHSGKNSRVNIVFELLSKKSYDKNSTRTDDSKREPDLFDYVDQVLKVVPNADSSEVFHMLESRPNTVDRVQNVINELKAKLEGNNCYTEDELNDPLIRDLIAISSVFPDIDKSEIFAYLEAHHDKKNRVQVVTEELLRIEGGSQTSSFGDVPDSSSHLTAPHQNSGSLVAKQSESVTLMDRFNQDVKLLMSIFPDCDPNYLFSSLEDYGNDASRVEKLSARMFETKIYPKLKDVLEKQKNEQDRKRLQNLYTTVLEFLHMFNDPFAVFLSEEKQMSENYKDHALAQLKNTFPMVHHNYCAQLLEGHNGHFTPCYNQLSLECQLNDGAGARGNKIFRKNARQNDVPMPEIADQYFYRERWFAFHQDQIRNYIEDQKCMKEMKIIEARERNELMECGCCYDDEVLFEDMAACSEGHLFCTECIRRSCEELIGQGKFKFPCLGGDCESEFSTSTLQLVLPHAVFSNILRRVQEEEVRLADLPGLESCPFCHFATIMPEEDKVFKCLNPECLKESCKLCKEPNHIPLKCEEVEGKNETSMRVFIEKRMTAAMVRTCWSCKKQFYKVEGCNKMTCMCGASMCYVCRQPIKDYDHFNGNDRCAQYTDMAQLHKEEVEKAAKEAKAIYVADNPDSKDIKLKYDPMEALKDIPEHGYRYDAGDESSAEDHYSEEDSSDGYNNYYSD